MKKNINKIILALLVIDAIFIYFVFATAHKKNQRINISNDSLVREVEIDYEVQGNPLSKIKVNDISNTNAGINSTAGNLGQSFDFTGNFFNFQLKNANISMKYDKEKLGSVPEENLLVVWYDEENKTMVEMDTKVDTQKGTVSFETDHFSEFILVNKEEWKAAWNERVVKVKDKSMAFELAFVIDDSGSMSSNDPQKLRLEATKTFVEELDKKDSYTVIKFEDSAKKVQELTTDKSKIDDALGNFNSSGGTNISAGLKTGINAINDDNNTIKVIILLTDGEDSTLSSNKDEIIRTALNTDISIFSIYLNDGGRNVESETKDIRDIALQTGGEFYSIDSDEVIDIFEKINKVSVGIDEDQQDTDGDGIADEIEIGGMRTQFGEIIYTNPYSKDTDGDDKSDGLEIGKAAQFPNGSAYYKMNSNPTQANDEFAKQVKIGPNRSYLGTWDSGFKLNKNAFQFYNVGIRDNGGVCTGIAYITEYTFNKDKWKNSIDQPDVAEDGVDGKRLEAFPELKAFYDARANNLFDQRFNAEEKTAEERREEFADDPNTYVITSLEEEEALIGNNVTNEMKEGLPSKFSFYIYNKLFGFKLEDDTIKNGLLYFYNPKSNILKDALTGNVADIRHTELEKGNDKDILNALFYYWIYANQYINTKEYVIDKSKPLDETYLTKLKDIFSHKEIIQVSIPKHRINAYALEKVSESEYRLYVYDSNHPYHSGDNTYIRLVQFQDTDGKMYYKVGEDDIYNNDDSIFAEFEQDSEGNKRRKDFKLILIKEDEIINYPKNNK